MRVLFAGTPDTAVPSLDALVYAGNEVLAVLTRPPARAGRGRHLIESPVAKRAKELGIEVLTPQNPGDSQFQQRLIELAPEVCPVVAYGALLPSSILEIPRYGWINLHFSVLPRWRGAAPVQRAVLAGDTEIGATTFQIVTQLDAGPIYRTIHFPLDPLVTAGDALFELSIRGAELLVQTIRDLAQGASPVPQPNHGISYAPKVNVEEARIDWSAPMLQVHNHIRGFSPHPGAWTLLEDTRVKILRSGLAPQIVDLSPGELRVNKNVLLAGTAGGAIELLRVQPFGKKSMSGPDWGRGRVSSGMVLE